MKQAKIQDIPGQDLDPIIDNEGWLPGWWLFLFWGAIAVGFGYAIYYHGLRPWNQAAQYTEEIANFEKDHPELQKVIVGLAGENPFRGNATAIEAGHKTFLGTCSPCHRPDATGLIGPNLTDAIWLHGNTDKKLFNVIMEGVDGVKVKIMQVPSKGPMPSHKISVGERKVYEVLAWLASKNPSLKAK